MPMTTPIYAEKITSLSDARYFSGMGVRWLGICVDPADPNYLSPQRFREIAGWVAGPFFVLEAEALKDGFNPIGLSEEYGISRFRIHPEHVRQIGDFFFGLDLRKNPHTNIESSNSKLEFLILNSTLNPPETIGQPILIPAPDHTDKAGEILDQFPGLGFLISGSAEAAVGLKEYDSREFLEYLENRE